MMRTRICGIPCRVEPTSYRRPQDGRVGGYEFWTPDVPEEVEFDVLDRRGRPAAWLESKLTDNERARIERELLDYLNRE